MTPFDFDTSVVELRETSSPALWTPIPYKSTCPTPLRTLLRELQIDERYATNMSDYTTQRSRTTLALSPSYRAYELESRDIYILTDYRNIKIGYVALLNQLTSSIRPLKALPSLTPYDSIHDKLERHCEGLDSSIDLASKFPEEIERSIALSETVFSSTFWLVLVYRELYRDSDLAFS